MLSSPVSSLIRREVRHMPIDLNAENLKSSADAPGAAPELLPGGTSFAVIGSGKYGEGEPEKQESSPQLPRPATRPEMLTKPYEDLEEIAKKKFRERRGAGRLGVKFPVTISIVFPQDTFTPFIEETNVINLTTRGAMGTVTIPETILQKVLREVHYCRLQFNADTLPQRILGQVRWYSRIQGDKTCHNIGIRFDNISDQDLVKLRTFVSQTAPH